MTTAAPVDFGVDIFCDPETEDADELFSEVSGLALVRQDLRHRLLTDQLIYNGTDLAAGLQLALDSADWGFDLRRLLGATAGTAQSYQARIKRVVLKDERIDSASVVITETDAGNGLRGLTVDVSGKTALGPFRLVFQLDPAATTESQVKIIVDQ